MNLVRVSLQSEALTCYNLYPSAKADGKRYLAATIAFLIQRAYPLPLVSTNGEYNLFSPVDSDQHQPEAVFRQLEASVRDLEAILRHLEAISDPRKLLLSAGTNRLNGLSCLLIGEVFNLTCNKQHRNTVD